MVELEDWVPMVVRYLKPVIHAPESTGIRKSHGRYMYVFVGWLVGYVICRAELLRLLLGRANESEDCLVLDEASIVLCK